MAYNGSGTFLINTAGQPVVAGTVISSTTFNALTADLATGLSTVITKDGQTTVTANIPMASFKFTGLGVGSAAGDSANLSQVQSTVTKLLASVSGADTVTATASPTLAAYAAGQMFYFVAAGDNTTSVTLNIDALGAKAVTRDGSVALAAADIKSGEVIVVVYDGTRFQVVSQLNSAGNATFANVSITSALNVGGVATFSAGSAAAPSITTTGDTNTGIFFPAADTIAFTEGGVESMRIDSSGQVGIGTASPQAPLHVKGSGATEILRLETTDSVGDCYIRYTDAGGAKGYLGFVESATDNFVIQNIENSPMLFYTNNTEKMRLDSSGNLGIGTASPGQKLEVAGNILVNTSGNPYAEIKTSGSGNNPALKLTADTNSWTFQGTFSNTYDDLLVMYNATTVLGVNNLGNFQLAATLTGNGHLYFTNSADGGTQGYIGDAKSLISGAANSTLGVRGESGILFGIGATERARITSGGTLLVGTTTGAYTGAGCINSEVSSVNDFCFSGVNTNATNPRGLYLRNTNTTAGDYAIYFEASAVTKFYVNGNGVIHSTNTSVQSISDARHKENVRDLDKGLVEVLALKPRRFDWKEGKGTGAKDVAGFIAQEVEAVLPELVGEWKESIDAKEKFKSIGMANVIPMLVKAIQEQQAIITALTARLTTLESK